MHRCLSLISWTYQLKEIEYSQLTILQFAILSRRNIQLQTQPDLNQHSFSVSS